MNTKQIMEMDFDQVLKLNRKDLSKLVTTMDSAANKRLRRLEKADLNTPALRWVKRSGGDFSVKGKNLNQLRSEFVRVKNFLNAKTSTQAGAKAVLADYEKRVGGKLSEENTDKFWDTFHKISELEPAFVHSKGSDLIFKMLREEMENDPNISADDLLDQAAEQVGKMYEEAEYGEVQDDSEAGVSDFFFM